MNSGNKSYDRTFNMIYLYTTDIFLLKKTNSILFNSKDP